MFDFMLGVFVSWYFALFVILFALFCDSNNESSWSSVAVVIIAVWLKTHFAISLLSVGIIVLCYLGAGILWSLFRWHRYCNETVDYYNSYSADYNEYEKRLYFARLIPSNNIKKIVNWVLSWPVSLINELMEDIYHYISVLVRKYCIGIYNKITQSAMSKVK